MKNNVAKSLTHSSSTVIKEGKEEIVVVGIQNKLLHTIRELEEADRVLAFIRSEIMGEGEESDEGNPIQTSVEARIEYMYNLTTDLTSKIRRVAIALNNDYAKPEKVNKRADYNAA